MIRKARNERNKIMKKIHKEIEKEETENLDQEIERLEKIHDNSNRMYEAANFLRRLKPKEKLIIQSKEGKTSNPKDCAEILTEHFQGVFYNKNYKPIPEIQPTEMKTPFTEEEIQRVIMSMKNNKSGGCDLMTPELIKYGDKEISKGIASVLNNTAKTGKYPQELKKGILIPLPKPNKAKGPPANCRPVILLLTLRKILTIIMIRRTVKNARKHPSNSSCVPSRARNNRTSLRNKNLGRKGDIIIELQNQCSATGHVENFRHNWTRYLDQWPETSSGTRRTTHFLLTSERCRDSSQGGQNNWKILHHKYGITSGRLSQRIPLHFLSRDQSKSREPRSRTSTTWPWILRKGTPEVKLPEERSSIRKLSWDKKATYKTNNMRMTLDG